MELEKFDQAFFDWTDSPSMILDVGGVIRLANTAFLRVSGVEEATGISFSSFLNEEARVSFRAFLNSLILQQNVSGNDRFRHFFVSPVSQQLQAWEWRFTKKDQFFLVQGKLSGAVNRVSFFERHGLTGIAVISENCISDANDRFAEMFGYNSIDFVIGKTASDFAAAESKPLLESADLTSARGLDLSMMRRDGSRFATRVLFEKTIYNNIEVTLMKVQPRKSTTQTLIESGLLFGAVFDSAAAGMMLANRKGKAVELNRAFCELLGREKEDMIGRKCLDLVHQKDRKILRGQVETLLDGIRSSFDGEIRLRKKNKRSVWVNLTVDVIRLADGDSYFLITANNIERRIKAEKSLAERAEELARSNDDLEKFAFIASHDLQEPLRTVSAFVQLLKKKYYNKLDDDANQYISLAVEGAARMHELIKELLRYSRISTEGGQLEQVNFNTLLDEVNTNLKEVAESNEANVLTELMPTVRANKIQMIQLFQNLIENAIKFKGADVPEIVISVEEQKDKYMFSVKDNGIGIEPEFMPRIFTLFQRLNNPADNSGTGIGLALCKRIVESHGGSIWVNAETERGSVFQFTLKK